MSEKDDLLFLQQKKLSPKDKAFGPGDLIRATMHL